MHFISKVHALVVKDYLGHYGALQPDCSSLLMRVLRAVLGILTYFHVLCDPRKPLQKLGTSPPGPVLSDLYLILRTLLPLSY